MTVCIPISAASAGPKEDAVHSPELSDEAFVAEIERRVQDTITRFSLFTNKDRILVAASGGKDSMALAHMLKRFGYPIEAVTVNAHIGCYTDENLRNLRTVCEQQQIPLHEISFRKEFGGALCTIRDTINKGGEGLSSCAVCGTFRRYLLNKRSVELNGDVLALGHNLDDEAQAFFMNLIGNKLELSARMGPSTGERKSATMVPRVKPLYFVSEQEIIRYVKILKFPVHIGKCPCSLDGQRNFVKDLFNDLETKHPGTKQKVIAYFLKKKDGLQSMFKGQPQIDCESCGEASSKGTCRSCQLLEMYNTQRASAQSL
ncbi:MAG TPA: TIGR00269 family protein [Candidatus Nanoarchaeia archaeon]|nr:TIGR00269 family protein [Candidatus Nanoarchaeia archaeon]